MVPKILHAKQWPGRARRRANCFRGRAISIPLLIAAFAAVGLHLMVWPRNEWASTEVCKHNERERPVFSTFLLAKLTIRRRLHLRIGDAHLNEAFIQLQDLLTQAAAL